MTIQSLYDALDWSVHDFALADWKEKRKAARDANGKVEAHPEIERLFDQHDSSDFRMLLLVHALRGVAESSRTPDPEPTEGTCIAARRLLGPVWAQAVEVLNTQGFFQSGP